MVFSIIGLYTVHAGSKKFDRNYLVKLFLWSYSLRVLMAIVLYLLLFTFRGEPFLGGGDGFDYYVVGRWLGKSWAGCGFYVMEKSCQPAYYYVVAFFYYISHYLGGGHQLVPIFFNCMLGALIPVYVYKIAFRLYDHKIARTSALLTAFFPHFVTYSAVLLKDIIIVLLITMSIWHLIEFQVNRRFSSLIMLILSLSPLPYFRMNILWVLFLYIALHFLFSSIFSRKGNVSIMIAGILVICIIGILFSNLHRKEIFRFGGFMEQERLEYMVDYQRALEFRKMSKESLAGESLGAKFLYETSLPMQVFLRPLFLLINPFPPWGPLLRETSTNEWNSKVYLPGGLVWYVLIPLWAIGLFYSIRKKRLSAFPIYGANIIIFFIVAYWNMSIRHRLMCMSTAMILAAVGIHHRPSYRTLITSYIVFYSCLINAYLYLKYLKHTISLPYLVFMGGMIILILSYGKLKRRVTF
jgi:4-amino-4-deoxy-L-arabinose transferase-like glycosyltransferase